MIPSLLFLWSRCPCNSPSITLPCTCTYFASASGNSIAVRGCDLTNFLYLVCPRDTLLVLVFMHFSTNHETKSCMGLVGPIISGRGREAPTKEPLLLLNDIVRELVVVTGAVAACWVAFSSNSCALIFSSSLSYVMLRTAAVTYKLQTILFTWRTPISAAIVWSLDP